DVVIRYDLNVTLRHLENGLAQILAGKKAAELESNLTSFLALFSAEQHQEAWLVKGRAARYPFGDYRVERVRWLTRLRKLQAGAPEGELAVEWRSDMSRLNATAETFYREVPREQIAGLREPLARFADVTEVERRHSRLFFDQLYFEQVPVDE